MITIGRTLKPTVGRFRKKILKKNANAILNQTQWDEIETKWNELDKNWNSIG